VSHVLSCALLDAALLRVMVMTVLLLLLLCKVT
jgi:hypothetical protein